MVIVDTSPLVAAAFSNDDKHEACVEVFNRMHSEGQVLAISPFVAAETCYMLKRDGGSAVAASFLRSLVEGAFLWVNLIDEDLLRTAELMEQYDDLRLDAADATIVALAERYNVDTLITLDYRDFYVVRPRHIAAFTLLPLQLSVTCLTLFTFTG
jgi:uncharacterized protein